MVTQSLEHPYFLYQTIGRGHSYKLFYVDRLIIREEIIRMINRSLTEELNTYIGVDIGELL